MEISFAEEALKEACLGRGQQASKLPTDVTKALRALYSALRSADHVEELPWGRPVSDKGQTWSVDLASGYKAVLRVAHSKVPRTGPVIDWTRVYRVQILSIENTDA